MTSIRLKADVRPNKYGLVVVNNSDGTFSREFRITEQELAALHASQNGVPPGVTQKEWEGGLAHVIGKAFDVGDVGPGTTKDQLPAYHIKTDERIDQGTGRIVESFLTIPTKDVSGALPDITVATDKLAAGVSVVAGVLTKGSE